MKYLFLALILFGSFFASGIEAACTETDGGNRPFVSGSTDYDPGNKAPAYDHCSGSSLVEYYCNGDSLGINDRPCSDYDPKAYCSGSKCVMGECANASNCDDGNSCTNDSCLSYSCSHTNVSNGTFCGSGELCYSGSCIDECTETDGGNRPFYSGYTTFNGSSAYDNCSGNTLREYYCSSGMRSLSSLDCSVHDPSAYCNTNKCVVNPPSLSLSADSGSIDLNESVRLTWTVGENAISCIASSTDGDWSGAKTYSNGTYSNNVTPFSIGTKTYTLQCSNSQGTRTASVTVNVILAPVTCTDFSYTIDSGDTQSAFVSSADTNRWSAVCEDFSCDNFACEYESPTYTQNYGATPFSGTFGSNVLYNNTSGSDQTRRCTFTVWNDAIPTNTGTCTGSVTVRSGAAAPVEDCTGYNYTIDSGDTQSAFVSSAGNDRWSAVCEDFLCDNFACEYESPTYTQNYGVTPFSGTFGSNTSYTNTSGSDQTRKCTFTVWNSSDSTNTGTCTGSVTVRSGAAAPVEDCTGYNYTIDSGDTQSAFVSSAGNDRWSAVCEDFSCDNFACEYESPTYTQNYGATPFSGTFGSNTSYTNTSGSDQTRKCTFTVWNSSDSTDTGTCTGSVTVRDESGSGTVRNVSFSRDPIDINLGESSTFTWSVEGFNSGYCTASTEKEGSGDWSGSKESSDGTYHQEVTPTSTGLKSYTLECLEADHIYIRIFNVNVYKAPPNDIPTAIIDQPLIDQTIGTDNIINFIGHGTDTDGSIEGYEWLMGDCNTGTSLTIEDIGDAGFNPLQSVLNYTFNTVGTYTVYFKVKDNKNAWSSCKSRIITVTDYSCTDIPNSTICPSDGIGLIVPTSSTVVADGDCSPPEGSTPKCEYTCNSPHVKVGDTCIEPTCIPGDDVSNASLCPNDNLGLSGSEFRDVVSICSDPPEAIKCEYTCNDGYRYDSDSDTCELIPTTRPVNWQEINP